MKNALCLLNCAAEDADNKVKIIVDADHGGKAKRLFHRNEQHSECLSVTDLDCEQSKCP